MPIDDAAPSAGLDSGYIADAIAEFHRGTIDYVDLRDQIGEDLVLELIDDEEVQRELRWLDGSAPRRDARC